MADLELFSEHRIRHNPEIRERVRDVVIEHRFSKLNGWDGGRGMARYAKDIDRHTFSRHDTTIEYIVPWVNQVLPLAGKSIVEIGCGTGSSTAAFAKFAEHVFGYDIASASIEGARARLAAHGISEKATFYASKPSDLLKTIEDAHRQNKVDIVLMFALLEHQTLQERLETLRLGRQIANSAAQSSFARRLIA